jgi:hypothetical protein
LELLSELVPTLDAGSRVPLITDLLSLLDFALNQEISVFTSGGMTKVRRCRILLESAMVQVIARSEPKRDQIEMFGSLVNGSKICLITTNYDFIPDRILQQVALIFTGIDRLWHVLDGD